MPCSIDFERLLVELPRIVEEVGRGSRFTVLYRGRPAFDIVAPGEGPACVGEVPVDSLHGAPSVGSSKTGQVAARHDEILYSAPSRSR